jgi:hypothetical protein
MNNPMEDQEGRTMDYKEEPEIIRQQPTRGPDGVIRMILNGEWHLIYFNHRLEGNQWTTDLTLIPKSG